MLGYIIVDVNIKDMEGFMEYASRIPTLIDKHGGRYIVKAPLKKSKFPQRNLSAI